MAFVSFRNAFRLAIAVTCLFVSVHGQELTTIKRGEVAAAPTTAERGILIITIKIWRRHYNFFI